MLRSWKSQGIQHLKPDDLSIYAVNTETTYGIQFLY